MAATAADGPGTASISMPARAASAPGWHRDRHGGRTGIRHQGDSNAFLQHPRTMPADLSCSLCSCRLVRNGVYVKVVEQLHGVARVFGRNQVCPAQGHHGAGLMSPRLPMGVATTYSIPSSYIFSTARNMALRARIAFSLRWRFTAPPRAPAVGFLPQVHTGALGGHAQGAAWREKRA